jgi:hypothetical protein
VQIASLAVTNYRAFGKGRFEIAFPEGEHLVSVIGANNAGKSSILTALYRALTPGRARPSVEDFYNLDASNEMRIELTLSEPLRVANIFRSVDEIGGFYWRAWRKVKGDESGYLDSEHYAFKVGEPGTPYVPPAAVGRKQVEAGVEPPRWTPAPAGHLLRKLGPVHHLDLRLEDAFKTVGRGILARVFDLYRDDFAGDHNTYTITEQEGPVLSRDAYGRLMARLANILRTDLLGTIETSLTKHLQSYLGREGQAASVSIGLPDADELLRRLLDLRVSDFVGGPAMPVRRMGAGYQSLLRLALLETHVELGLGGARGLYLIEEPEAYLHPHLRRHMRSCLQKLADQGNDVVIVTHDPDLIDLTRPQSLLRLARPSRATSSVFRVQEQLQLNYEAVARKVGAKGNGDLPFANAAILCEGQDDVAVLRILAARRGYQLDSLSISVADCGGVQNLPDYAKLCSQLGIPYLLVTDGDASKAAHNKRVADRVAQLRAQVQGDSRGCYFAFTEDLEAGLAIPAKGFDSAVHTAENLLLAGDDVMPELPGLLNALDEFIRRAARTESPGDEQEGAGTDVER